MHLERSKSAYACWETIKERWKNVENEEIVTN